VLFAYRWLWHASLAAGETCRERLKSCAPESIVDSGFAILMMSDGRGGIAASQFMAIFAMDCPVAVSGESRLAIFTVRHSDSRTNATPGPQGAAWSVRFRPVAQARTSVAKIALVEVCWCCVPCRMDQPL